MKPAKCYACDAAAVGLRDRDVLEKAERRLKEAEEMEAIAKVEIAKVREEADKRFAF